MSLVNGRGPQAKRCGRDGAKRKSVRKRLPLRGSRCVGDSPRKPLRHHREAATAREGAKHHREATPQRKARHLRESNLPNQQHRDAYPAAKHHREAATARDGAKHHREAAPQCKARHLRDEQPAEPQHRDEQPAEPAASGRATCRTSSIGKSTFCQIMVPKGQVLRW